MIDLKDMEVDFDDEELVAFAKENPELAAFFSNTDTHTATAYANTKPQQNDSMSKEEMDDEIIRLNARLMALANARIAKYGNKK